MNKVSWDDEATKALLVACMDQIEKGQRHGKKYTSQAWDYIVPTFNNKASKDYEKKHLQNRLVCLWNLYRAWVQLLKEPGAGREYRTNNVVASREWWTYKIEENKAYKNFRLDGLKLEEQMRAVFEGATTEAVEAESPPPKHLFLPNSTQPLRQQEDLDWPSEGSGDSKGTGVTDGIRGIGLKSIPSASNPELGSRGKMKSEGSVEKKRNKKALADALSVYNASPSISFQQKVTSYDDALNVLDELDEFHNNEGFQLRCFTLVEDKNMRQLLISIYKFHDAKYLLGWLKHKINSL